MQVIAHHLRSTTALVLCKGDIYPSITMLCHTKPENYGTLADTRKHEITATNSDAYEGRYAMIKC